MTRLVAMLAALLLPFWTPLAAHTSPNTEIRIESESDALTAAITVPASYYADATGAALDREPELLEQAEQEVARRFAVSSGDGLAWSISVDSVDFSAIGGPADLNAIVTARPVPGAPTKAVDLRWDMFPENAPGHIAMIMMGEESNGEDAVMGALTATSNSLTLELGGAVDAIPAEPAAPPIAPETTSSGPDPFLIAGIVLAALIALGVLVPLIRSKA